MDNKLICVRGLSKYFAVGSGPLPWNKKKLLRAIDGVSFEILSGETFGLVGESGCGKTTLSKLILLLEYPTEGAITFEGKNIHALKGRRLDIYRQSVQAVFQDPFSSLSPRMRVAEIVGEPLIASRGANRNELNRRTLEILAEVGLAPKQASLYPHQFSGGQRQRIAVARALITHPKFIILDEPVSALDVSIRAQILNLLQDLKKRFGLTYLFIAHDLLTVRYMSDRIGVMYLGKLVEVGESDDVYSKAVHPYSQLLLKSALPTHPRKAQEWIVPVGEVPDPINPPPGCRFNTRCPQAQSICQKETPALKEYVKGHWVACHLI